MDGQRFDRIVKGLRTRRSVFALVAGIGALLGLGHEETTAKKCKKPCGPCKRCKKGKCKKRRPDGTNCGQFGVCRNGRCVEPFCAGKNVCTDQPEPTCHASGTECYCFVTADTGEPFCGLAGNPVATCNPCAQSGAACVNGAGALCQGGLACSALCPDPR